MVVEQSLSDDFSKAALSVLAQFNNLLQNVRTAKLNVYLGEVLVCESSVDITTEGESASGMIRICSFNVEDV